MFGIVPWPPLLLCCLLCGQTMGLIWPLPAVLSASRSTSLAQPPLPSTAPPPWLLLFSLCVCVAWRVARGLFCVVWQGQGPAGLLLLPRTCQARRPPVHSQEGPGAVRGSSPSSCTDWQGLTLSHPVRHSRAPASEG